MNKIVLRGDIFTTNLGRGVGSEHSGVKYCLVIQNDVGNQFSGTTVVIPITKEDKGMPTHYRLTGVLEKTSYVVTEQIRVIDKSRLKNRVARVSKEDMKGIADKIRFELGI